MVARRFHPAVLLALWLGAAGYVHGQSRDAVAPSLYLDLMTPEIYFGVIAADEEPRVVERALRARIESDVVWSLSVAARSTLQMAGRESDALPIERIQWRPHDKAEAVWQPFELAKTEILSRQTPTTDSGRDLEHDYRLTALWGDAPGLYRTVFTYTVAPSLDSPVREPRERGGAVISGKVSDRASRALVEEAVVLLVDSREWPVAETTTDAAGEFAFDALADGEYSLRVSRDYYYTTTQQITITDQRPVDVAVLLQHNRTLLLTRELDTRTARLGDIVRCTLRLTHIGAGPAIHVSVVESLPHGIRHLPGHASPPPAADQAPFLVWNLRDVTPGETMSITYLIAVDADADAGAHVLTAQATAHTREGVSRAAPAVAEIHVISTETMGATALLVGVVYEDVNGNGRRDRGEAGIAEARVVADNGAIVRTDRHGRYSLADVSVGSHTVTVPGSEGTATVWAPAGGIARVNLPVSSKRTLRHQLRQGGSVIRHAGQDGTNYIIGVGEASLAYDPYSSLSTARITGRAGATLSHSLDSRGSLALTARLGDTSDASTAAATLLGDGSRQVRRAPAGTVGLMLRTPAGEARVGAERVLIEDNQFATYGAVLPAVQVRHKRGDTEAYTFVGANVAPSVMDEITPDGTTGPYRLSHPPVIPGSESVRIESRDPADGRTNSEKRRTRIVDYGIDYVSGEIVFREPVTEASAGNDVVIVVEYQKQRPRRMAPLIGPTIYGARATTRLSPRAVVGATLVSQVEVGRVARLLAADARLRPRGDLSVRIEGATTNDTEPGSASGVQVRYEPSRALRADSFAYNVSKDFGHTVTPAHENEDRQGRIGLHEHRMDRVSRTRGVKTRGVVIDVRPTRGTWVRAQTRSDVEDIGSGLSERVTLRGAGVEYATRSGAEAYVYGEEGRTVGAKGAVSARRTRRAAGHWPIGRHALLASAALSDEDAKSRRSTVNYAGEWKWWATDALTTELRYARSRRDENRAVALRQDAVTAIAEGAFGEGLRLTALVGAQRIRRPGRAEETRRNTVSLRARAETEDVYVAARVKASRSRTVADIPSDSSELSIFVDGVARDVLSLRADYSVLNSHRGNTERARFDLTYRPTAVAAPDILVTYSVANRGGTEAPSGRRELTVQAHSPFGSTTTAYVAGSLVRTRAGAASVTVGSMSVGARREVSRGIAALFTWQSVGSLDPRVRMVFAPGVEWRHPAGWSVRASYGIARRAMPTWATPRGLRITVGRAVSVATDRRGGLQGEPLESM